MNDDLNKLYPSILKAHAASPYHFEKKENADAVIKAYNPICGDRFEMYVNLEGDHIGPIYFQGFGCSVSKASTSVLAKSLEGKTVQEGLQLCSGFLSFITKESVTSSLPEELLAFSGVRDFPERLDCAALSWREIKKFLESRN